MHIITRTTALRQHIRGWRLNAESIALVPTMGHLHAGHLSLISTARTLASRVVVSIFVNPLQFGPREDFEAYPRTPDDDVAKLANAGVDLLFMPDSGEIYPKAPASMTYVEVPELSHALCGQFRPGHFRGVATVVLKLFNLVQPDCAVFGAKDYQQWLIVNRLVQDLDLAVSLHRVDTLRESSGLALSSRNAYLSVAEKSRAAQLYGHLCQMAEALRQDDIDLADLEFRHRQSLEEAGFVLDYLSIRRQADLGLPDRQDSSLVVLVAARLGKTRLIDNLFVERHVAR